MRETIWRKPTPVGEETTGVRRQRITNRTLASEFKPVAQGLSESWAADAADTTQQAVRYWREGERAPSGASLLNLGRESDAVWEFICEQVGRPSAPIREHDNPRAAHAFAMLQSIALNEGPDGEAARRMLRKLGGSE